MHHTLDLERMDSAQIIDSHPSLREPCKQKGQVTSKSNLAHMQHGYVWINSALQLKEIHNQPCAKHIVFFQKIPAALCKDSPARYDRKRRIASFNSVAFSQIYILACAKQNTLTTRQALLTLEFNSKQLEKPIETVDKLPALVITFTNVKRIRPFQKCAISGAESKQFERQNPNPWPCRHTCCGMLLGIHRRPA